MILVNVICKKEAWVVGGLWCILGDFWWNYRVRTLATPSRVRTLAALRAPRGHYAPEGNLAGNQLLEGWISFSPLREIWQGISY